MQRVFAPADIYPHQKALFDQYAEFLMRDARVRYDRRGELWSRDFSSDEAYIRSVEPNRRSFLAKIGGWPWERGDLELRREPLFDTPRYRLERIHYRIMDGIRTNSLLLVPHGEGPFPALLTPAGVNTPPETVCGLTEASLDPTNIYHRMGARLAEHGYLVLAPRMVTGFAPDMVRDLDHRASTLMSPIQREARDLLLERFGKEIAKEFSGGTRARGYLDRLARTVGNTLLGVEMFALSRCLDLLSDLPEVAPERMGMYGISQGGHSTMWLAALDQRIAASVCGVYFDERFRRQLVAEKGFKPFALSAEEEHMFPLLDEFSDSDIASLICPRPFAVEAGLRDDACEPGRVREAFAELDEFYSKLGAGDRCQLIMHEGGHEVEPLADIAELRSVRFLDRWLKQA